MYEETLKHLIELDTTDLKSSQSNSDSKDAEAVILFKNVYTASHEILPNS